MRLQLFIILALVQIESNSQCGSEYPSAVYHNSNIINYNGDTLNKRDSSGYYEGLHVYTDNQFNLYGDKKYFVMGHFKHGVPIGEWLDHCEDGSFSIGQFSCGGGEQSQNEKGIWITKKQGIYVKIGVWKYFDKDSNLLKTERYDRQKFKNGWANHIYRADSSGNFILVKFESKFNYSTKRRKETTRLYTDKGLPVSADYESFWKDISYEYDSNGQLSKTTKQKKFLGKNLRKTVEKEYNSRGKVKCKTKTKCKHPESYRIINEVW